MYLGGPLCGMYFTYVLRSSKVNRTYVGFTSNIDARLKRHNSGQVTATKSWVPWKLLFSEKFNTATGAKKRELYWKSGAGRRRLKELFDQ